MGSRRATSLLALSRARSTGSPGSSPDDPITNTDSPMVLAMNMAMLASREAPFNGVRHADRRGHTCALGMQGAALRRPKPHPHGESGASDVRGPAPARRVFGSPHRNGLRRSLRLEAGWDEWARPHTRRLSWRRDRLSLAGYSLGRILCAGSAVRGARQNHGCRTGALRWSRQTGGHSWPAELFREAGDSPTVNSRREQHWGSRGLIVGGANS